MGVLLCVGSDNLVRRVGTVGCYWGQSGGSAVFTMSLFKYFAR